MRRMFVGVDMAVDKEGDMIFWTVFRVRRRASVF